MLVCVGNGNESGMVLLGLPLGRSFPFHVKGLLPLSVTVLLK